MSTACVGGQCGDSVQAKRIGVMMRSIEEKSGHHMHGGEQNNANLAESMIHAETEPVKNGYLSEPINIQFKESRCNMS